MVTLRILQQTEHWLAVDKPSGVTVHNRAGEDILSLIAQMGFSDMHAVHRLDAGTSGVILLAKGQEAARFLHEGFANRSMDKTYLAAVHVRRGCVPNLGDQGVWSWSLSKRAESRKNPRGWAGGRVPCRTGYEVLSVAGKTALIRCEPLTGRKHQIRRHATLAGWPLVGDYRYGVPPVDGEEEVTMRLHAVSLAFLDPWAKALVQIESPPPVWATLTS